MRAEPRFPLVVPAECRYSGPFVFGEVSEYFNRRTLILKTDLRQPPTRVIPYIPEGKPTSSLNQMRFQVSVIHQGHSYSACRASVMRARAVSSCW